jgi:hypothetical protein
VSLLAEHATKAASLRTTCNVSGKAGARVPRITSLLHKVEEENMEHHPDQQ